MVKNNDLNTMRALIDAAPNVVHARSSDGRGPLWWAYEFKREGMKQLLIKRGCDPESKDRFGMRAMDVGGKKQVGSGIPTAAPSADSGGGTGGNKKKGKKKSKKKKA